MRYVYKERLLHHVTLAIVPTFKNDELYNPTRLKIDITEGKKVNVFNSYVLHGTITTLSITDASFYIDQGSL